MFTILELNCSLLSQKNLLIFHFFQGREGVGEQRKFFTNFSRGRRGGTAEQKNSYLFFARRRRGSRGGEFLLIFQVLTN